jgi:hypothetical protein
MVKTGATRAMVTGARTVTATQKGAKLQLSLPFSKTGRIKAKSNGGTTGNQRAVLARIAEIQAVAQDESRAIGEFVRADYTRRANEPGVRRRVRIGRG